MKEYDAEQESMLEAGIACLAMVFLSVSAVALLYVVSMI